MINLIQNQFEINFVKVASHTDIPSNEEVDTMAKAAAGDAVSMFENDDPNWDSSATPAVVDMQRFVATLKDNNYIKMANEFSDRLNNLNDDVKRNDDDFFNNKDYLLLNALFYDNGKFRFNIGKLLKHELFDLSTNDAIIISKLRCEHIELNGFLHEIGQSPSPMCCNCNVIETVNHFLMNCPILDSLRSDMRLNLREIDIRFDDEQFFTIENILFPHLWVELPEKDDEDYKEKWQEAREKRVSILEQIARLVTLSRRFEGKEGD